MDSWVNAPVKFLSPFVKHAFARRQFLQGYTHRIGCCDIRAKVGRGDKRDGARIIAFIVAFFIVVYFRGAMRRRRWRSESRALGWPVDGHGVVLDDIAEQPNEGHRRLAIGYMRMYVAYPDGKARQWPGNSVDRLW